MGFYANPATPAARYVEGHYATVRGYATSRTDLPNTVTASYHDAGYYLQWDRAALAPGESWTIQAVEVWTPGGALQLVAPAAQNVAEGSIVSLPFTVQNLGTTPLNLSLSAASSAGWATTLAAGATVTVPALGSLVVNVSVEVPAGASGASGVTLTASGDSAGSASTQLTVVQVGLGLSPSSVDFGELLPGEAGTRSISVTNTGSAAVTLGALYTLAPFAVEADGCSGTTLAVGASCQVVVRFTSLAIGPHSGTLNLPVLAPLLLTRTVPLLAQVTRFPTTLAVDSSQNPSVYAGAVAFLATVAPASATGTVQFQVDGVDLGAPVPLSGGAATSPTIDWLAVGTHTVTALYSGDGSHQGSSGTLLGGQVVEKAAVSLALSSSLNPSRLGQAVVFSAEVAPEGATGSIQFQVDGVDLGGPVAVSTGPAATLPLDSLAVGTHAITATYSGDGTHLAASGELAGGQVVLRAEAAVSVGSSRSPSAFGQAVTFIASVSPAVATGTIQFQVGGVDLGSPVPIASGAATSVAIATLAVGAHAVTARYSGDASYLGALGSLAGGQVVERAVASLGLGSAQNPIVFGASVSFTASVVPATATGTIQFRVDGADLGSPLAVSGGSATSLPVPGLRAGTHAVQAVYSGDGSYLGATTSLTQQVDRAKTSIALVNTPSTSVLGQAVRLTATVTSPSLAVPEGAVSFLEGASVHATGTLDGAGAATASLSSLAVGTHSLVASFAGDANHERAVSAAVVQVVEKAQTTTGLALAPNPSLWGQEVTLTASVAPVAPASGVPSGTVSFSDGVLPLGASSLAGGVATLQVRGLHLGQRKLHATYSGDDGFLGSLGGADVVVSDACLIAGREWPRGAVNPESDCQVCEPSVTASAWTHRAPGSACAADGLACTADVCDGAGQCSHPVASGCVIEGACVEERAIDPANPCRECNPTLSGTRFVPSPAGAGCADDGVLSTLDVCDGTGACMHPPAHDCLIAGLRHVAGAANPDNACQSCDPTRSTAAWTNRAAGSSCASDGLSCTWDACDGSGTCRHEVYVGCLVGGACVAAGERDPGSDCRACDPARAREGYAAQPRGAVCGDDGDSGTWDVCDGAGSCGHPARGNCLIDGVLHDAGSVQAGNACWWCAPTLSATAWSPRAAGTACGGDGLSCTLDVCDDGGSCAHEVREGCLIEGACVGAGGTEPGDDCRACDPVRTPLGYSVRPAGVSCRDDGELGTLDVCDSTGRCVHPTKGACTIDGAEFSSGATNPANPCELCAPERSPLSWSPRAAGFPCNPDGLSCTQDVCDAKGACTHPLVEGCVIDGACVAAGFSSTVDECLACLPELATTQWTVRVGRPDCQGPCTSDEECRAEAYCSEGGVCRPLKPEHEACATDRQCASGHCIAGRCLGLELTGGGCSCGQAGVLPLLGLVALLPLLRRRR